MTMTFDRCFHLLLGHEGGFVDHPKDPGGATRWGVTERVARANGYAGPMRDFPVEKAKEIYRRSYWDAARCDDLPSGVRYAVFDGAVNSGVAQSVKWLQRAVEAADDGVVGPETIHKARAFPPDLVNRRMLGERLKFMTNLPTWSHFGRGWARRVADLLAV